MQEQERWISVEHPGYFGKSKDEKEASWNEKYGLGNWRIAWQLNSGKLFNYLDIFWKVYVPGYVEYFYQHREEAVDVTNRYAYGYDKDLTNKGLAFDPQALVGRPGLVNQFHHVSFNIALEYFLGLSFKGQEPVQIRDGGRSIPENLKPAGWRWSPGRIPTLKPDLIPSIPLKGWWEVNSVEDFYQRTKVLQIKTAS